MTTGMVPAIIAHRGAGSLAPENTLAAIHTAITLGIDGIECDIRSSADGDPILLHDTTLDRTTDGTGPVATCPLEVLQTLDAGRWFGASFTGERIPTLREALHTIDGRLTTFLELKDAAMVDRTAEIILDAQAVAWCAVISFSEDVLSRCAACLPHLSRALLLHPVDDPLPDTASLIRRLTAIPANTVGLAPHWMTPELLAYAHEAGIRVLTGPLDDERQIAETLALGPDLALTNRPDVLMRYRGKV